MPLMLLRRFRIDIGHMAPCTPLRDIQIRNRLASRSNSKSLPAVFVPGLIRLSADQDVRPEPRDVEREVPVLCCLDARVEFVDAGLVADEDGHQVWEAGACFPAEDVCCAV